ncbi:MAG: hypothetical protein ACQEUZ_09850 [Pseudomonadota bacterium]
MSRSSRRPALPLALAAALAACAAPQTPTRTTPSGALEIAARDGLVCHGGRCLILDLAGRTAARQLQAPVAIPAGMDLSDGWMTREEFDRLDRRARQAPILSPKGAGVSGP